MFFTRIYDVFTAVDTVIVPIKGQHKRCLNSRWRHLFVVTVLTFDHKKLTRFGRDKIFLCRTLMGELCCGVRFSLYLFLLVRNYSQVPAADHQTIYCTECWTKCWRPACCRLCWGLWALATPIKTLGWEWEGKEVI